MQNPSPRSFIATALNRRRCAWLCGALISGSGAWAQAPLQPTDVQATAAAVQGAVLPRHFRMWVRVPGCARSIAAGAPGQVIVTGCDAGAGAARSLWHWRATGASGGFVPEPANARLARLEGSVINRKIVYEPVRASGLAIDAAAQIAYAIGPDARLHWRRLKGTADGVWHPWIGSRDAFEAQLQVTAVAAGGGLSGEALWVVSALPGGAGGNKIHQAGQCNGPVGNYASGRCWQEAGGAAAKVALAYGTAWVVSTDGGIFRREGDAWAAVPGCARDITGQGDHLYVVGCETGADGAGKIYRYFNGKFRDVPMTGSSLAVDVAGSLWVVKPNGDIWRESTVNPAVVR